MVRGILAEDADLSGIIRRTVAGRDATTVLRTRLYPGNKAPVWAKTDIDAFRIMDDWGMQNGMIVSPDYFRKYYNPLYSEYVEIAHSCGKFASMHFVGNITEIIPDLNEAMIDVLNSQLFCMSIEDPGRKFRGKITFWGEIDRQNILPNGTKPDIESAVKRVYDNLRSDCAVTGQCEFGPAEKSENIFYVFEVWNKII